LGKGNIHLLFSTACEERKLGTVDEIVKKLFVKKYG